jgi:Ca2+-binding RTX toxin-like protein
MHQMATVTLYQPTDMSALPMSTTGIHSSWSKFEIDSAVPDSGFGPRLSCLGSFITDPASPFLDVIGGTISRVQIDDGDFGTFPNLDITGLSYTVTENFFSSTLTQGHIFDVTAALLGGDDTIIGTVGSDWLLGFDGNDTFIGGAGADGLVGGFGNDTASYVTAATGVVADLDDNTFGTGDARGDIYISIDNLVGSAHDDVLYGNHGDNRLSGGAGPDILVGEAGADTLDGGPGSDTVAYDASGGGLRADLLMPATNTGDAFGDSYISIENLDGSSFDDILLGDNKANVIGGNLYHDLASGNDQLYGRGGNDQLFGYDGNDTLIGGAGADALDGGTGTNTASYATAVSGVVADLDDNEFATGDAKGDTFISIQNLTGSRFADTLYGDHGDNRLSGGAGNDILVGEAGADRLDGGAGVDTVAYDASGSGVRADLLNPATNTGDAKGDSYILVENLDGSSFDDVLLGDNGANVIGGNLVHSTPSGNDRLYGRGGNDQLFGSDGNDLLEGGAGADRMTGGAGKDIFLFDTPLNAATNVDRITDFTPGADTIRLAHADFAALAPGALPAAAFYANPTGAAAHDGSDRIVYDAASGGLYYDANGSASGGSTHFATLSPHLSLTAGDFFAV